MLNKINDIFVILVMSVIVIASSATSSSADTVQNVTLINGDQYKDELDTKLNLTPSYDYNSARTLIGATKGELNVNQGQANYSVSIGVPPGVNGMEPKLSLNYTSNADNGYVGLGWDIGGVSVITRCAQTKIQDGDSFQPGINYTSSDRFCIDGKRLINIKGSYGASGTEYRTEIDTYSQIKSYGGSTTNGPNYFKVKTKEGYIYTYGNDGAADGFISTSAGKPRYWKVKKIEDRFGNSIDFNYFIDKSKGIMFLTSVKYADNTVKFEYEDRPDNLVGYEAEYPYEINKRLLKVSVYTQNEGQFVRSYSITYTKESYGSDRSRLASITENTSSGSLKTLRFDWSDQASNKVNVSRESTDQNIDNNGYIADLNGDGYADIFIARAINVNCEIKINNRNNGFTSKSCNIGSSLSNLKFVDYDGDGDIDIYEVISGSYYLWKNDGNGYFGTSGTKITEISYTTAPNLHFMDLNSDGLSDLVLENNYNVEIYINNNGSFSKQDTISNYKILNNQIMFNDFNADGAMDIYALIGKDVYIWLNDSKGNFPSTQNTKLTLNYSTHLFSQILIADFNGDGLMDIYEDKLGDTTSDYDYLYINKGNAKFSSKITTNRTKYKIEVVDFNGDGLADIYEYGYASYSANAKLWINQGNNSFTNETSYSFYGYIDNIYFGDFNGDGYTDIYEARDSGFDDDQIWINQSTKPLINHIYNEKDENINIAYEPLTNDDIHYNYRLNGGSINYSEGSGSDGTFGTSSSVENYEISVPLYVVTAAKMANGLGGQDTTNYAYKGYSVNRYRGALGFYEIYRYHSQKKELEYTKYKQQFPFIGSPSENINYLNSSMPTFGSFTSNPSGVKVSTRSYTYEDKSYTANYQTLHQVNAKSIIENTYDPGSAKLLTTQTNTKVLSTDRLGNITSQIQTILDRTINKTYKITGTYEYKSENVTNWIIGKVTKLTSTKETVNESDTKKVATEEFTYEGLTGALSTHKKLLDNSQYLLKSYIYTSAGNVESEALSGTNITALTNIYRYGYVNKFKISAEKMVDGVLFYETFEYDPRFGEVTKHIDPNGHETNIYYNALGQKETQVDPDGSKIEWYYSWGGATNALYAITTIDDTKPYITKYYDLLDREVLLKTHNLAGNVILQEKAYNAKGLLSQSFLPYISGDVAPTITYDYDNYSRLIKLTKPSPSGSGASIETTSYSAFSTIQTDAQGYKNKTVKNALNQIINIVEGVGSSNESALSYRYDGLGNLMEAVDNAGNITSYTYDNVGRKISESDPDRGIHDYEYDALGNMTYEKDARGTEKTYSYDALSRLKSINAQNDDESLSKIINNTYDNKTNGIGEIGTTTTQTNIASEQSEMRLEYYYDDLSRLSKKESLIDNETHSIEYIYDYASRAKGAYVHDGSGVDFNTYYVYKNGFLFGIKNPENKTVDTSTLGYVYYADQRDAWGNVVNEIFGNGVQAKDTYNGAGYINTIYTIDTEHSKELHTIDYGYDHVGNVIKRKNIYGQNNYSMDETFTYDALRRINSMNVSVDSPPPLDVNNSTPLSAQSISMNSESTKVYRYDAIGNILQKGSINDYSYDSDKPHAVESANGKSYTYDASGNMLSRGNESISYTVFDKPYALTNANGEVTKFYYDGNENRYKKKTSSYETLYLDKIYERKLYSGEGTDEFTGYFYFGDKLVAMQVLQGEPRAKSYRYTHADSLGSISFITDEDANIVEQRSYEPFGEIRSMNYGNGIVPANMTNITTRSFTNHEQIGEMEGLIHMDGRVYDSTIGRFVSADIHVPDPYSTQSYNRYSYVKNNSLGFTDPSGYDGTIVNKAGLINHLIQQKIDTAPESIPIEYDHTPKYGGVKAWATQQVRLENPDLFVEGGKDQNYLIDVKPTFFKHGIGEFIGSIIGDPYAAYFNNGHNPITNRVMFDNEIMDNKVLGLAGMIPVTKVTSLTASPLKNLGVAAKGLLERVKMKWGESMINTQELIPTHAPTMSKTQFRALKAYIKENGLKSLNNSSDGSISYVVHDGNKYIVNGHHRVKAAKQLDISNVPAKEVQLPFRGYKDIGDL
ncbi:conserved hypothetical protein [Sulfurovum sp. enrichment culture clone C5]|uniref:Insecticide toxin TcdB middle/N-terminal domain-containing protein n=1 Tax=Sulfurovum sp. enrichment culture clone C5 TaxID=497650 RepID=A0A0S4XR50_9BACT|nr:conserved hypothetical protein [Sulfurovum sp. enrichment culture clone C5]